jgi:hypothetical protein
LAAPTPDLGYLHSATLVKAGVFLLPGYGRPLGTDGGHTRRPRRLEPLLLGAYFAIFQQD